MKKTSFLLLVLCLTIALGGCRRTPETVEVPESQSEPVSEILPESEMMSESESEPEPKRAEFTQTCYRLRNFDYSYSDHEEGEQHRVDDKLVVTSVEDGEEMPYYLESGVSVCSYPYGERDNFYREQIGFRSVWMEKFTEEFFAGKDLLLFWIGVRGQEVWYEASELVEDAKTGKWQLHVTCHSPKEPEYGDYTKWLLALEVEKGLIPKDAFPEMIIHHDYQKWENHWFSGEHGVILSNYDYEVWTLSTPWHWGVKVDANEYVPDEDGYVEYSCYAEVAYFRDGFVLDPAARVEEYTTPQGQVVTVGFEADGDWLWVDYGHPSGKYAAFNYGASGANAKNLLNVVLTAQLGE
ncbi:MAG: hypothetical protein IJF34_13670 [Clostridia bacterium]|nr:hypothetical protein [Clostridia bacterium]MBQ4623250.1 hypothetical protein [Clostridia bacterium]